MTRADRYYFSRKYALGIEQLEPIVHREPTFSPAEYNPARAYALAGNYDRALNAFRHVAGISQVPQAEAAVAYACALAGDEAGAKRIEENLEQFAHTRYLPSPQLALIRVGLGDQQGAFNRLRLRFEEKSFLMIYLKSDPVYDGLRNHPEFVELLRLMKFPK